MRRSRESEEGKKGRVYKTMVEDEKTRTYIFKQRKKIEEKEGRERGRIKETGIKGRRGEGWGGDLSKFRR